MHLLLWTALFIGLANSSTPKPVSTCSPIAVMPTPTSSTCNVNGTVKHAAVIKTVAIPPSASNPFEACVEKCFATKKCLSFAYTIARRDCTLYSKTLGNMTVVNPTSQNGVPKDDLTCYKANCCVLQATTSPTISLPSPTALSKPHQDSFDDTSFKLQLPFNVSLFQTTSNVIWVNVNGVVFIGKTDPGNGYYSNQGQLPLMNYFPALSATILAFNEDLYIVGGSTQGILYEFDGVSPNQTANIEYYVETTSGTYHYHFIYTFYEASQPGVTLTYYQVPDYGVSALVGAQNGDGSNYTQYEYHTGVIVRNLQLVYNATSGAFDSNSACIYPD